MKIKLFSQLLIKVADKKYQISYVFRTGPDSLIYYMSSSCLFFINVI